jgi:diaminohydroxyphosphoribosylaminopyrimidine deaminase/5-amino-6-(5-phosphoribosylamino)uracil reductase
MRRALELARKGLGRVSPNPMVGCVVVRGGRIVAEGWHKRFGGDHAEIDALKKISGKVRGTTMYVTLEPCHHFGKTPPCVGTVIASGVCRVVVAMRDPNPLTAGKSIRKMRRAGIVVSVGILGREARDLDRFFIKHVTTGLPYVVVKVARSRDGMISTKRGSQGWITGPGAKRYVQKLRAQVDAVLVGRGTILIDDPLLNVRDPKKPQPRRVILDSELRTDPKSRVFASHGGRVMLFCSPNADRGRMRKLEKRGAETIPVRVKKEGLDLKAILKELGNRGIASVLVEGGSEIFTAFARQGLADEWQVITAPRSVGAGGKPAFRRGVNPSFQIVSRMGLGEDELVIGRKAPRT